MSSISPIGLPGTPAAAADKGNVTSPEDLQNVGKDEFLKLLVAQLQNQDPLNPLRNEEFVAQLATFSSLERLISIDGTLSRLAQEWTPDTLADNKQTTTN